MSSLTCAPPEVVCTFMRNTQEAAVTVHARLKSVEADTWCDPAATALDDPRGSVATTVAPIAASRALVTQPRTRASRRTDTRPLPLVTVEPVTIRQQQL